MQLHTLVVAGVTGVLGLFAGRATRPDPDVQAAPARVAAVVPPAPRVAVVARPDPRPASDAASAAADPAAGDDDTGTDDAGGEDVGALLAGAQRRAAELRLQRNAIFGHVDDPRTGQPLAGATVLAASPALAGTPSAVTDERGDYAILDLPAGNYRVTIYYGDASATYDAVQTSELDVTRVTEELDPTPAPSVERYPATDDYIVNIPVGRTFETVLGSAAGSQGDALGVSFTGTTSLENTFYVDGTE